MDQEGRRPELAEGPRPELVEGLWVTETLLGDRNAFAHLVDAYKAPVYNLCYRMLGSAPEAEDAAQETFVRVYTRLKTYNPRHKLSSWILVVASHYCIDLLRRRRIKWLSLDQVPPLLFSSRDRVEPEDVVVRHESSAEIRSLLQSLPAEYRLVIVLRYWQDLSYAEMAQVLGTTEGAIKSRLHRARRMLAQQVMAQRKLETQSGDKVQAGKKVIGNAVL